MSCLPTRDSSRPKSSTHSASAIRFSEDILKASKVPGIEASTGSLGHGLSYGIGMALAARMQNRDSRIFVVMGDGEINEGSVWEAAMCAGKHRLANLTAIIDYNKIQSAGATREIQDMEPLLDKWRAFGFTAVDVDGHDVAALRAAYFAGCRCLNDRPAAIICHTVKGKGLPFAENDANWHHKAKIPPDIVDEDVRGPGLSHARNLPEYDL